MVRPGQPTSLQRREDRFVEVLLLVRDLLQDDLLGQESSGGRRPLLSAEGESVGQHPPTAQDPHRGRALLVRKSLRGGLFEAHRTAPAVHRFQEAALRQTVGEGRGPPWGQPVPCEVLLLEHGEVLRPKSLEAATDLVRGEAGLGDDLLLVQGIRGGRAQRDEDSAFRTGEGNRLRSARSGIGRAGHGARRGNAG